MKFIKFLTAIVAAMMLSAKSGLGRAGKSRNYRAFLWTLFEFWRGLETGIEAYQKLYGKSAGGQEIELVFRDLTAPIRPRPRRWPRNS